MIIKSLLTGSIDVALWEVSIYQFQVLNLEKQT